MKKVLQIQSSLFTENSASRQLAEDLVAKMREHGDIFDENRRNLAEEGVPHLDAAWIQALSTPTEGRTSEQRKMVDYSDQLINEVMVADVLVIGAPMYNFSVPSVLKAWFDHITRAGVTFQHSSEGPKGLLTGKTAYVITTRGGLHKDKPTDNQVPFIKTILSFIGIHDVHVIYAEGLNMSGGHREKGFAEAKETIDRLVAA